MKKIISLLVTTLAFGVAMSQTYKQHRPEPLEFQGDGSFYFTVYVNDVIQNHRPATTVQVTSPIKDNTTILIVVEENDRLAGRYLHLTRKDANGLFYVLYRDNLVEVFDQMQYDEYLRHNHNNHLGGNHNHTPNQHSSHNSHNGHDHNDHCAVTSHEFEHILSQIENETFDDSRLKLAKSIFNTHFFTSVQIKALADKFTFSKNRMNFVEMAYDRCVDKADFYIVNEAFTFKSDKDKLNKFIQRQQRR